MAEEPAGLDSHVVPMHLQCNSVQVGNKVVLNNVALLHMMLAMFLTTLDVFDLVRTADILNPGLRTFIHGLAQRSETLLRLLSSSQNCKS